MDFGPAIDLPLIGISNNERISKAIRKYLPCLAIRTGVVQGQETTDCFLGFSSGVFTKVVQAFGGILRLSFYEGLERLDPVRVT